MDEQQALARIRQGEIEALAFFVARYHLRAVRTAYLIVRDRAAAEDIVQSAFIRAYERAGRSDVRAFGPWFLRSVVNAALQDAMRRERQHSLDLPAGRQQPRLAELLPALDPGPETLAEQAELRESVWQALGQLPPAQRATVVQRYYLGMSELEMARAQACPEGTIKWRLHAARQGLRRLLRSWRSNEDEESILDQQA